MKRLNAQSIIGLICVAVSLTILWISHSFPKATTGASDLTGPSFYPNVLALVFIFCGVCELINGFRSDDKSIALNLTGFRDAIRNPGVLNVFIIIVLILCFILFMEVLGFFICSYLMLFILMWRFGVPFLKNVAYSAAFVVMIYLIFGKLFTIYLPSGILDYIEF